MIRRLSLPAAVVAMLLLALSPALASAAKKSAKSKAPSYSAQLVWTLGGIPHITANDWGGLGYGAGYAAARDNLCQLADNFVTTAGERSKWFEPGNNQIGFPAGPVERNLKSDFFWQYVKKQRIVEKLIAQKPPLGPYASVRQGIEGYAAGYNRYLSETGVNGLSDPRCKGQKWVRKIKAIDLYRRFFQLSIYASSGQDLLLDALIAAEVPKKSSSSARFTPAAGVASATPSQRDLKALAEGLGWTSDPQLGSNGLAAGAEATQSGGGIVLGNPHFPWRGTERLPEQHFTIPGKVNVTGAALMGVPVVLIGHNEHVAWTHTVSTARRFVVHQLKLAPGSPTTYIVDGKKEKMKAVSVTVKLRGGKTRKHTFYQTRYGLAMSLGMAGYLWNDTTAYALGDINATNMRMLNTWFDMDQAKSVKGLVAAQSKTQGNPWVTTSAADDYGDIVFTEDSAIPNVSAAKQEKCKPGALADVVFQAAGVVALDGSKSSCDLGRDKGAVTSGILSPKHVPIIYRRDYVANSNDSYWLVHPSAPVTGFAPIIGPTKAVQNLRTRVGISQIERRLDGSDGLGAPKFSLPTLEAMWEGDRSMSAELIGGDLAALCETNPSAKASDGSDVDISQACAVLAAYDGTGRLDSKGGWLFNVWYHLAPSDMWKVKFDLAQPLATPNTLDTANPAVLKALADAVQELRGQGIALDASYGDVQHALRGEKKIPIHGCDTGCYNNIDASRGAAAEGPYGEVYYGSSFVMMAEMTKSGPKAQAIETYSQSTNPLSPHFGDQTELFSRGEWVPMLFTPGEINNSALERKTLKGK